MATHEVFDTYKDPQGETYLALRSEPLPKAGTTLARMLDGTGLVVESQGHGPKGAWWKVRVVTGEHEGVTGYAHSKWIRPTGGEITTSSPPPTGATPKAVRTTPRHLVGLPLERLLSLCDDGHDGEACLEGSIQLTNRGDHGRGLRYLAGGCKFGSGQACAGLADIAVLGGAPDAETIAKARRLLFEECLAGRDDSCVILAGILRRTETPATLDPFVRAATEACRVEGTACVLARELAGALPAPMSPSMSPEELMKRMAASSEDSVLLAAVHPQLGLHVYEHGFEDGDRGKIHRTRHLCGSRLQAEAPDRMRNTGFTILAGGGEDELNCERLDCSMSGPHVEWGWHFREFDGGLYLWAVSEQDGALAPELEPTQERLFKEFRGRAFEQRCR